MFNTAAVLNLISMVYLPYQFYILPALGVLGVSVSLRDMSTMLYVLLLLTGSAYSFLPPVVMVLQAVAFHSMPEEVR